MADQRDPERSESRDEALDPHRRETRSAVEKELEARLWARGVRLTGEETSDDIADVLDAVERFERAVQSRGGDLMVNQRPGGRPVEPDDGRFVVPERRADESVDSYLERLREATRIVLQQPRRAD
jgi:hypothetical protein